ncbi:MAG: DotI/IcmL family type IV secretion protein [Gammaproteobacteria bacterium]|nr:DotI/IcmL family type IV secretion protein [Gammaproteobacteria bacterium]
MNKLFAFITSMLLLSAIQTGYSAPERAPLAVWVNEAIVATYTYDFKNYLQQQKDIAKYFTANGWISYSKALIDSKLPETVNKNSYEVSAVATQPPVIADVDPTHWLASMPVLVVYKNPQYQQQQHLKITLGFTQVPSGQGVRGFAITSLQSKVIKPPCECKTPDNEDSNQESKK